jgi:uncharacterized protein YceK
MEVIGAVAATGQLIGTAYSILGSIARLRDELKHAPTRYQGWHTELATLSDTISDIRDNSKLQTRQVSRIVEEMAPKIDKLADLCVRYTPEPDCRLQFMARLRRALSTMGKEPRILQNFQSLEHDKTNLILMISTLSGCSSIEHSQTRQDMGNSKNEEQEKQEAARAPGAQDINGMYHWFRRPTFYSVVPG